MELQVFHDLRKKITALLEKNVGSNFGADSTGTETAGLLRIAIKDIKTFRRARNYLLGNLRLPEGRLSNKSHGNGNNHTLIIEVRSMTQDGIDNLNKEFARVFNGDGKKLLKSMEEVTEPSVVEVESIVPTKDEPVLTPEIIKKSLVSADKQREITEKAQLGRSIHAFLAFERLETQSKPAFKFKESTQDDFWIVCSDENIAISIEKFLSWMIADRKKEIRSGNDIIIDRSFVRADNGRALFCFPPYTDDNDQEVKRRVMHAVTTPKPSITKGENEWCLSYKSDEATRRVYEILLKMGWSVKIVEGENSVILYPEKKLEKVEPIIVTDEKGSSKEITPTPTSSVETPTVPPVKKPENASLRTVAESALEIIFFDPELSAQLSEETKDKILASMLVDKDKDEVLSILKKFDPEKMAQLLLGYLKK